MPREARLPVTPVPLSDDVDAQLDAAMAASRVFVAVIAESMAELDPAVTMPQFRTLVLLATRGPSNLTAVAELLGVHPSNATRTCDRLVRAGLIERRQSVQDRRHLILDLTSDGREQVRSVMRRRRLALRRVLAAMPAPKRRELAGSLRAFGEAAGEIVDTRLRSEYALSLSDMS
jgi:DNA-binding MarR family transcriptional regulator